MADIVDGSVFVVPSECGFMVANSTKTLLFLPIVRELNEFVSKGVCEPASMTLGDAHRHARKQNVRSTTMTLFALAIGFAVVLWNKNMSFRCFWSFERESRSR